MINSNNKDNIARRLLIQFVTRSNNSIIHHFLLLGTIAFIISKSVNFIVLTSWIMGTIAILFFQWSFFNKLVTTEKFSEEKKLNITSVANGCSSIWYSLTLFSFLFLQPQDQLLYTVFFVTVSVLIVVNANGYRPFLITHFATCVIPLTSIWIYSSEVISGESYTFPIITIALSYSLFLTYMTYRIYSSFRNLVETQLELELTDKNLQIASQQAENASDAQSRFLAAASHDLRQPIHSLTLFCSALSMKPLDDKVRDIANHMTIAIESLGSQLDAILDVSKLDAGLVSVNKSDVNLSVMLSRAHSDFLPLVEQKALTLHFDCPSQCNVLTDSNLLERMVRNLLSNAVKYTDTGEITIQVVTTDKNVFLNIIDTGIGIAEEEQEQIFEEFHQLNDSERNRRKKLAQYNNKQVDRRKGLGLGLAIVRRHAELLDIELKLSSQPRLGSIFTLRLEKGVLQSTGTDIGTSSDATKLKLTVLVVDDEPEIRLGMKTLLEILGYSVIEADCTDSAVSLTTNRRPDIALIDFRLSEYDDGLITIRRLRVLHPGLPAIIISGDTEPQRLKQIQKSGIELLHKPVLVEALKKAIATTVSSNII